MTFSRLPDVAKAEQLEIAKTEEVSEECRKRLDNARMDCQHKMIRLPAELQDERRKSIQQAKEEAEITAGALIAEAEQQASRVDEILQDLSVSITQDMVRMVLPLADLADRGETNR
ncbi:hypothetical protein BVY04_02715 [bacterium M21]|nr:hypothetical protein BVY04_02715 [bacterium M21]